MAIPASIICIVVITIVQYFKFKEDKTNKDTENKFAFLKSKYLLSAIYELSVIFLGAVMAIQLTDFSNIKTEKKTTIALLQQISEYVSMNHHQWTDVTSFDESNDSSYNDTVRNTISTFAISMVDCVESELTQDTITKTMSSISYVRIMDSLSRLRVLATWVIESENPAHIYKQMNEEIDSINSCISMEIEHLKGLRSERNLGDWIGKNITYKPTTKAE